MPRGLEVHLILDNATTHKTKLVGDWLRRRPRFHLHFTSTSSSWLNLVECWFASLTRRRLKRGVFRSTDKLEEAIRAYNWSLKPDYRCIQNKVAGKLSQTIHPFGYSSPTPSTQFFLTPRPVGNILFSGSLCRRKTRS